MNISSRVATAGLVGFLALDVVLVGVALRSNQTSGIDTSPVGLPSASTSVPTGPPSTTSTPSGSKSSPSPKTTVTAPAAPLRAILVALDNQRAWRVHVGSCSAGGATLATTTDGGRTWVDARAPLRTIIRVRPLDSQNAFVIGAASSCVAELKSTTDGGGSWGQGSDVGRSWFRDPKNPKVVGAPGASTSRPCRGQSVLDLAVLSTDSARVLCADGRVRSTTDTGVSWTDSGRLAGAVALAVPSASPEQTYVVRLGAPDCAGVQVRRIGQRAAISCLPKLTPSGPGQVTLSLVNGGGWLGVGDITMRSTDGLLTWRAP